MCRDKAKEGSSYHRCSVIGCGKRYSKGRFVRVLVLSSCLSEDTKKPIFAMYGLDRVTALIEAKKAALVIIAHDVDPIELVICFLLFVERWAYRDVIVKGKARLGTVVHKKTAVIVAIQEVRSGDDRELATLISVAKTNLYGSILI